MSATDFSGVQALWFTVWPEVYPPGWPEDEPVAYLSTYADEGSITFVPGWADTYTVEAWAENSLFHRTAEGAPETATFDVVE